MSIQRNTLLPIFGEGGQTVRIQRSRSSLRPPTIIGLQRILNRSTGAWSELGWTIVEWLSELIWRR